MKKRYLSSFSFDIIRIRLDMPNTIANFCILFCFLSIFISNYTFCQKLSPEVISSAGDISKTASVSLEWTLGETIIESSKIADKHYTQGFHQSYLKVKSIFPANNESSASGYNMSVSPNPVEAILEIQISTENVPTDKISKVDLFLIDMQGQQFPVQNSNEKPGTTFLDMSAFPSGVYFLKAQKENGLLLKSFKIIKVR